MTTAVSTRPANAVSAPSAEPRMTPMLRSAVDGLLNLHPDIGPRVEPLPQHVQIEAQGVLARYEALCKPVTKDRLMVLLLSLNAAVKNPVSRENMEKRAEAIWMVVEGLPASVFTASLTRQAIAKFDFWPSAAELHALVRGEAAPLLRKRDVLRKVVAGPPADQVRPPVTDEERAAVEASMATLRRDMEERAAAREEREARPAYLGKPISEGALAAIRNADPRIQEARAAQRRMAEVKSGGGA